MMMTHPATGLAIGDPDAIPLTKAPTPEQARAFFDTLVLSASGWRGVFGRDDDDRSEAITPSAAYVAGRMAAVFADFLLARSAGRKPVVALGLDTRPTGPAIADVMSRAFAAKGLSVRYAFICAAPEIMAWARNAGALAPDSPDRLDAFCYISASHNPPGHNGVKFGLADGGVLPADAARPLIAALRDGACAAGDIAAVRALLASVSPKDAGAVFSMAATHKRAAVSAYTLFAREVAGYSADLAEQERELDALGEAVARRGAGLVVDMNGSARCLSIDADYLASVGVNAVFVNDQPRRFAHRIVPEGESLEPCRRALEEAHKADPSFVLGYVPDCDGDRGNIVYWDEGARRARALEAQETFALAALSELVSMERRRLAGRGPEGSVAVACNDATSLRVEAMAAVLGAAVRRSETGEANVVGLARELRGEGAAVRILGEGSNGGVITWPASVRDPLNTVTAVLRLLCLRDEGDTPGLYRLWLRRAGREAEYRDDFNLSDVLESLPAFATTSVFEDRAALRVRSRDHAALKRAYEPLFRAAWPGLAAELEPLFGRLSWKALASAGTGERPLDADFGASGSGGLKLVMSDEGGRAVAFLWMRGSGTEPVFRIMADVSCAGRDGAPLDGAALESRLLAFHAELVLKADSLAQ